MRLAENAKCVYLEVIGGRLTVSDERFPGTLFGEGGGRYTWGKNQAVTAERNPSALKQTQKSSFEQHVPQKDRNFWFYYARFIQELLRNLRTRTMTVDSHPNEGTKKFVM